MKYINSNITTESMYNSKYHTILPDIVGQFVWRQAVNYYHMM